MGGFDVHVRGGVHTRGQQRRALVAPARFIGKVTYWHSDLDLSGNYWGTTDIEEIAEGIYDCEDSDDTYHCVIFEPLADIVAVELRTWSAVKELFE